MVILNWLREHGLVPPAHEPVDAPQHRCDNPDHAGLHRMIEGSDDIDTFGQDVAFLHLKVRRLEQENRELWRGAWKTTAKWAGNAIGYGACFLAAWVFLVWLLLHRHGR